MSVVRCPFFIEKLSPWLIGVTGFVLAGGFAVIPFFWEDLRPLARGVLDGVPPPFALAWLLAGLFLAGTAGGLLCRGAWRLAILTAMMVCVIVTAEVAVAPRAYAILQGPLYAYTRDAARILGPGDPLVTYGLNAPSVVFYADRRVVPLGADRKGLAALQGMLGSGRPLVVITREAHARDLNRLPGLSRIGMERGYAAYSSIPPAKRIGG